jgi:hypothetical protein
MSVTLLILGIVVAAAGVATIGFGSTVSEFSLGTTSIIAGTTALTGGLILIGLSAVVTELGRVAEALRGRAVPPRPTVRPVEATEPAAPAVAVPTPAIAPPSIAPAPAAAAAPPSARPSPPLPNGPMAPRSRPEAPTREAARATEPYPLPAQSAVEVSAAAIERLRSSISRTERPRSGSSAVADVDEVPLSPNGAGHGRAQPRFASAEPAPPEPQVGADERAGAASVEAPKGSRLDFLFRSKPGARSAPQSENFDTFWPSDPRSGRNAGAEPQPRADEIHRYSDNAAPAQASAAPAFPAQAFPAQSFPAQAFPAQAFPTQAPAVQERRPELASAESATILKSGVVDGMAYTLYSDGSIEAKLPHGTVRFGSIGELRAHIESNS